MDYLTYLLFRFIVAVVGLLPFKVLYFLSDGLTVLLHDGLKYRKNIIQKNLTQAFPAKTTAEIKIITKASYQNFSDIVLEALKGFSLSETNLKKRYRLLNPETTNAYFDKGQSLMVLGSHFANWEWGVTCVNLYVKHPLVGIYKPLQNQYIEAYLNKKRSRFGMGLAAMRQTAATFEQLKEKCGAVIMMADQSPSSAERAVWIDFLHQDTACIHGPEKYGYLYDFPVFYFNVQRLKRGYYTVEMLPLIVYPAQAEKGQVVKVYMQKLEEIIKKNPANWLWTHRRWKKQRVGNTFVLQDV